MKEIINRIENLRKMKKSSQEEMAQLLGINRATYSRIERGKSKLSVEHVIKIARFFGVSIEWLLTGKEFESPKEKNIIDFSSFGEYRDTAKLMFKDMIASRELMHTIFADYFFKKAVKDIKNQTEE